MQTQFKKINNGPNKLTQEIIRKLLKFNVTQTVQKKPAKLHNFDVPIWTPRKNAQDEMID